MNADLANQVNAIIGIVGAILGVLGLLVAWQTKRQDWRIAEKSGSFRRPNLDLRIFGFSLGATEPHGRNWYLLYPSALSGESAVYELTFTIENRGDAVAEDVMFTLQCPKFCFPNDFGDLFARNIIPRVQKIDHARDSVGNFALLSFMLPSISPGSAAAFDLPFLFEPVFGRSIDVKVPLKEGPTLGLKVQYDARYEFNMTIYSRDNHPQSYQMLIGTIRAGSLKEAIEAFIQNRQQQRSRYKSRRLLSRLKWWLKIGEAVEYSNFISYTVGAPLKLGKSSYLDVLEPKEWAHKFFVSSFEYERVIPAQLNEDVISDKIVCMAAVLTTKEGNRSSYLPPHIGPDVSGMKMKG